MRALLVSPLGFLIGLSLGALGGGGSILAVPVLVDAAGQDPRAATTTSLLLVGSAALVGVWPHWRARRVDVRKGVLFGLTGIGGSLAGSALNRHLDPNLLLLAFAVLVCIAAWRMLTACPTCTKAGEKASIAATPSSPEPGGGTALTVVRARMDKRTVLLVVVAGSGVRFLTGLFGVGGGFVIVPALTLVLGLSMPVAIGTSMLVIAINAPVALATRLATTTIDWPTTLPFAVAAIAGVITGSKIADRLDAERSLRWFAALLVLVAVYTAARAGVTVATS